MPNGEAEVKPVQALVDADLDDINRALARLKDAESLIQKAAQAGIDVESFRKATRDTQDKLAKIKQAFFPGR